MKVYFVTYEPTLIITYLKTDLDFYNASYYQIIQTVFQTIPIILAINLF